jgi:hypothetical protein
MPLLYKILNVLIGNLLGPEGVEVLRWHTLIDILLIMHGLPYILLLFLVVFQELALIIHQFI